MAWPCCARRAITPRWTCPWGFCLFNNVAAAGFAAMTARLATLAGGRVVPALEGGYNLAAISTSAAACLRVLPGEDGACRPLSPEISPLADRALAEVLRAQWLNLTAT